MGIQHWKQDGIPVAELTGPEKRIVDAPSALELAMTARHEAGASALLVDKAAVAEDFSSSAPAWRGDFGEIHPVPDQNGRLRRLFLLY
ncbi:MAG: hypothetical protein ACLRIS_19095 [Flavonifractor plautii]